MASEREYNQRIIDEFRANEGRVGGHFEGRRLLLLHSVGAKTGAERVNPLMYQAVGGGYAVFGTNDGASRHPGWYHNLLAHPTATIEVGTTTIDVTAREADEEERASIWSRQMQSATAFAEYEGMTSRRIPVVILEPLRS